MNAASDYPGSSEPDYRNIGALEPLPVVGDETALGEYLLKLPYRRLGRLSRWGWLAFVPTLFLVLFFAGPGAGFLQFLPMAMGNGNNAPPVVFSVIFLTILFFTMAIPFWKGFQATVIGVGIVSERTHCDVLVDEQLLKTVERVFWFRFNRECEIKSIESFQIEDSDQWQKPYFRNEIAEASRFVLPINIGCGLTAYLSNGKRYLVAIGYPKEYLESLQTKLISHFKNNKDLAQATGDARIHNAIQAEPMALATGDAFVTNNWKATRSLVDTKPAHSTIEVSTREDGVTFFVPAKGLLKGSKGLFGFALFWNAFILFFQVMAILTVFGVVKMDGDGNPIGLLLFVQVFQLIGIAMLVASIYQGRKTTTVATSYGMLLVSSQSIFGKSTKEWESEQIDYAVVGPSNVSVNEVPVMELQIYGKDGTKFGTLSQCDNEELEWIASEIRRSIGIRDKPSDAEMAMKDAVIGQDGLPIIPIGSSLKFEKLADGWTLVAPPIHRKQNLGAIFLGLVITTVGVVVPIYTLGFGNRNNELFYYVFFFIWSSMFLLGGLSLAIYSAYALWTTTKISLERNIMRIEIRRPWGTKSYVVPQGNLLSAQCTAKHGFKSGSNSSYHLILATSDDPSLSLLANYSIQDLVYVRGLLTPQVVGTAKLSP